MASVKTAQKGTVLIVDDDPDICSTLQIILEYDGYTCYGVGTSNRAMELLHSQPFDLVITDLYLQGSNCTGMELIELLEVLAVLGVVLERELRTVVGEQRVLGL